MYKSPKVKLISSQCWEVVEDWATPYGTVAKGTVTNGASIPWWLQWAIKPDGVLFDASVYHDYCYQNAIISKKYADDCFNRINKDRNVNLILSWLSYQLVKLIGKGSYK